MTAVLTSSVFEGIETVSLDICLCNKNRLLNAVNLNIVGTSTDLLATSILTES